MRDLTGCKAVNKSPKTLFDQLERYLNEISNEIQFKEHEPLLGGIFWQPNEVKIDFLGLTKFEYSIVAGIAELLNFQRYWKMNNFMKLKVPQGSAIMAYFYI